MAQKQESQGVIVNSFSKCVCMWALSLLSHTLSGGPSRSAVISDRVETFHEPPWQSIYVCDLSCQLWSLSCSWIRSTGTSRTVWSAGMPAVDLTISCWKIPGLDLGFFFVSGLKRTTETSSSLSPFSFFILLSDPFPAHPSLPDHTLSWEVFAAASTHLFLCRWCENDAPPQHIYYSCFRLFNSLIPQFLLMSLLDSCFVFACFFCFLHHQPAENTLCCTQGPPKS